MKLQRKLTPWILTSPAILIIALSTAWPLLRTVYFSLTDRHQARPESSQWIGFENYFALLSEPEWWKSVLNTCSFAAVSVTLETIFGIALALLMNMNFRGRTLLRCAVLLPWAIPTVVSARIWAWMLNDNFGVINEWLVKVNLIDERIAWLSGGAPSFFAVVCVDVWKTTPFMALLVLAALQSVPKTLYEVAKIDGISKVRFFFHVLLPFLKPAILVAVIFRFLDALRLFDLIYVLVGNAPSVKSMSVYAYEHLMGYLEFGYGSAAATSVFAIIAIFTGIYLWINRAQLRVS